MKKPFPLLLVAMLALACLILLVWFWHHDLPTSVSPVAMSENVAAVPPPPPVASDDEPDLNIADPVARAALLSVQRALHRRDVRSGELVLNFKDAAALARFVERANQAGLSVIDQIGALRSVRVRVGDVDALQRDIVGHPADYADLSGNYLYAPPGIPTKENRDSTQLFPFGNDTLGFIGATGDRSQWGRNVTIAILDTGVALDGTFGASRLARLDIGYGLTPGTKTGDGHGTSVASLAAGSLPDAAGVAPAANLLSIRVTDTAGFSDIFAVSQGILTAVDAGARVINISLGGYATNSTLGAAIDYAYDHGVVIVAAAGNDQATQLTWPAADTRVVSVGAVDKAEQQVIFSNSSLDLQLSAPGYGVQSAWTDGQRVYVSGTSASAPLVAGAIAAVLSQNPGFNGTDAVQLLTHTASDAGAPGADPAYGNGILNLTWAMNANNPAFTDTAISSLYFDTATNQMEIVVQNRGGQAVSGLTLAVTEAATTTTYVVPPMLANDTQVIKVPVDIAQLNAVGILQFTSRLVVPMDIQDRDLSNNLRAHALTAKSKGK